MRDKSGLEIASDIGRFAYKMARIAKAAIAAGIKGALLEAARSFAPQVIKIGVCIIAFLIALPFLVFAALPNIFFGFSNAEAVDVQAMTSKAAIIEDAYKSTKDYNAKRVKDLMDGLSENYDDVQLTEDLGNTNDYWFIAICSVAYKQDLFSMKPEEIKNHSIFNFNLLSIFTTEEEYEVKEGETIKKLKRIKVNVKEMNPEEVMDQLAFTEEQKNWARAIYRTMADDQNIRPGSSDYSDGPGIDYGSIVFKEGATEVVYFNQADSRWGSKLYGKYDDIKTAGCGPTSLAIVVSSLTDRYIEPGEMADWAYENGYRVEGSGSSHDLIPAGAKHFGLNVEGCGRYDGQKIADALADGKLVIAIMGKGHFTDSGHFMVLRGVTEDGKILIADPASRTRTSQEWDLSIILNESRRGAGGGGPFWIISK